MFREIVQNRLRRSESIHIVFFKFCHRGDYEASLLVFQYRGTTVDIRVKVLDSVNSLETD